MRHCSRRLHFWPISQRLSRSTDIRSSSPKTMNVSEVPVTLPSIHHRRSRRRKTQNQFQFRLHPCASLNVSPFQHYLLADPPIISALSAENSSRNTPSSHTVPYHYGIVTHRARPPCVIKARRFCVFLITHVRLLLRGLAASLHRLLHQATVHRSHPLPRSSLFRILSTHQIRELLRPVSQVLLTAVS